MLTTKENLLIIKQGITEGRLLPAQILDVYDCDEVLDQRDNDSDFEKQWLRINAEIKKLLQDRNVEYEIQQLAEDIRRESFLAISRVTVQHEIASYISDDFGLIAEALMVEYDDPWLNGLWVAYKNHRLPTPPIKEIFGELANMI